MTDETKSPETQATEPTDFVMRAQVGFLFAFKSTPDAVREDMHALFEKFIADVKALDVAPYVAHLIDGDAMSKEDFDKLHAQTVEQARHMQELLKTIKEAAGAGADVQITGPGGQVLRSDSEIVDDVPPYPGSESAAEVTIAGESADAIEASEGAFRVGGTRTLN